MDAVPMVDMIPRRGVSFDQPPAGTDADDDDEDAPMPFAALADEYAATTLSGPTSPDTLAPPKSAGGGVFDDDEAGPSAHFTFDEEDDSSINISLRRVSESLL